MKTIRVLSWLAITWVLCACAPEVGSKAWCDAMADKPKTDWSLSEAGDYAKHCVFE